MASAVYPTTYRLSSVPLPVLSTSVHETLLTLTPLSPILQPEGLGPVAASFPVAEPISTSAHFTVGFVGERLNVASSWQRSLIGGRKGRRTGNPDPGTVISSLLAFARKLVRVRMSRCRG